VSLVDVGVQTVIHVPNQDNEQPVSCEEPVGDPCTTAKFGANLDFVAKKPAKKNQVFTEVCRKI